MLPSITAVAALAGPPAAYISTEAEWRAEKQAHAAASAKFLKEFDERRAETRAWLAEHDRRYAAFKKEWEAFKRAHGLDRP